MAGCLSERRDDGGGEYGEHRTGVINVNGLVIPNSSGRAHAQARGEGLVRSELVARGRACEEKQEEKVGGSRAGDDWMEPQELEEALDRGAGI